MVWRSTALFWSFTRNAQRRRLLFARHASKIGPALWTSDAITSVSWSTLHGVAGPSDSGLNFLSHPAALQRPSCSSWPRWGPGLAPVTWSQRHRATERQQQHWRPARRSHAGSALVQEGEPADVHAGSALRPPASRMQGQLMSVNWRRARARIDDVSHRSAQAFR